MKFRSQLIALAAVALGFAGNAMAAATITNTAGTLALGVNDLGHLNTGTGSVANNSSRTGIAYKFADGNFYDATSPGCFCEGWGVSVNDAVSGYANEAAGTAGLSFGSFASTANTATTVSSLSALSGITITHEYAEAAAAPGALGLGDAAPGALALLPPAGGPRRRWPSAADQGAVAGPGGADPALHLHMLVWAVLFGWLFFGDVPDRWTLLGAAVVIAAGLYTAIREQRLRMQR